MTQEQEVGKRKQPLDQWEPLVMVGRETRVCSCPKALWDHLLPQEEAGIYARARTWVSEGAPWGVQGLQVREMSGKDKEHEGLTLHTALKVGQLCALPPPTGILCLAG